MLAELAVAFHRKGSAILRYVMQWQLAQTMAAPGTVRPVGMLLEPERLQ